MAAGEVIRKARSISEALELFKQFNPPSSWAYLVVDTNANRAVALEVTNKDCIVREMDGSHAIQTNHFLTELLKDKALDLNVSLLNDTHGRYERVQELLRQARGKVDREVAMSILADQIDPLVGVERGLGATIGVHTTVTSVVLDKASQRVYVANGMAPVPHNEYVAFPLIGTFERENFGSLSLEVLNNDKMRQRSPLRHAAMQVFIEAKAAYEFNNDLPQAFELLKRVVQLDGDNPAYYFELAVFAMKNGEFQYATKALSDLFECSYLTPQLERLGHYYRGRAYAHLGLRDQALADLNEVIADPSVDPSMKHAAEIAHRRTARSGRYKLSNGPLRIMMQLADMLSY